MERTTSIKIAKEIMRENFIGLPELKSIQTKLGIFIADDIDSKLPVINYDESLLITCKDNFLLILVIPFYKDLTLLNLKKMRDHFGTNPDISEPCFYNQDWYLNDLFFNKVLDFRWYLIRKSVIEETRSQIPDSKSGMILPSAVLCAYSFFVIWYCKQEKLWSTDYVWCDDVDHNGDRIYVGRYIDPQGINKNGFSIHRHLKINKIYGCINVVD